jgi:hypothetical protein
MMVATAAEALERFARLSRDDLEVTYFYEGKTPRQHPSAILRVLGDELKGPADCPPRIMPLWLAKAAQPLFNARLHKGDRIFPDGAAKAWGLKFYGGLARLDGNIPFSVIHEWHANTIVPLVIEFSERSGPNPWQGADRPKALQALHAAALAGRRIRADEWRPVLHDAFAHMHADGRMGPAVTAARRYTLAETIAMNADVYAKAYADADAAAFAHAYWYIECGLDAYADLAVSSFSIIANHARLIADPNPNYDRYQYLGREQTCVALARLADGLVESLARLAP